jgi:hypothetical protein
LGILWNLLKFYFSGGLNFELFLGGPKYGAGSGFKKDIEYH